MALNLSASDSAHRMALCIDFTSASRTWHGMQQASGCYQRVISAPMLVFDILRLFWNSASMSSYGRLMTRNFNRPCRFTMEKAIPRCKTWPACRSVTADPKVGTCGDRIRVASWRDVSQLVQLCRFFRLNDPHRKK